MFHGTGSCGINIINNNNNNNNNNIGVFLQPVIIPSVDGVLCETMKALDSPRALAVFTEILYTCPDCSVSCVEVDDGSTVTAEQEAKNQIEFNSAKVKYISPYKCENAYIFI